MSTSPVYIGVDVAKATLALDGFRRDFPNTPAAHSQIIKSLPAAAHIVVEASGGYQKALVRALHRAGVPVSTVNARHPREYAKSMGQLAKTDKIDKAVLSAFAEHKALKPDKPPTQAEEKLAEMLSRREQLVAMRITEKNRFEHHFDTFVKKQAAKALRSIERWIAEIDTAVSKLIDSDTVLKAKSETIRKIDGIGPVCAAGMLGYIPELGTLSRNAASALAGLAPYADDSGTIRGKRKIYGGRAAPRALLYMAALTAARKNPILMLFYQRLRKAGKPFKVAIVAVMRKLIMLINQTLKNPNFVLAS
ncbi:MAG: IS110 family transposase [Bacteroidota bacterium]